MSFYVLEPFWVSIPVGFLDYRLYLWLLWLVILLGTWGYLLSAVGVDHLGSTQLGGSAFSLLPFEIHPRTPWLELLFGHLHLLHSCISIEGLLHLWCIYFSYDGYHSSCDDWMYQILWTVYILHYICNMLDVVCHFSFMYCYWALSYPLTCAKDD